MNDTTRKYPRTLDECIPSEYAQSGDWEYAYEREHRVSDWIITVMCVVVVGLLTLGVFQ